MQFKSVLGAAFRNQLAETIFAQKYKHEGAETWEELAQRIVQFLRGENKNTK